MYVHESVGESDLLRKPHRCEADTHMATSWAQFYTHFISQIKSQIKHQSGQKPYIELAPNYITLGKDYRVWISLHIIVINDFSVSFTSAYPVLSSFWCSGDCLQGTAPTHLPLATASLHTLQSFNVKGKMIRWSVNNDGNTECGFKNHTEFMRGQPHLSSKASSGSWGSNRRIFPTTALRIILLILTLHYQLSCCLFCYFCMIVNNIYNNAWMGWRKEVCRRVSVRVCLILFEELEWIRKYH